MADYQIVVETIAATTTDTGLSVDAVLDTGIYPTGKRYTDAQMKTIPLTRQDFHGAWNYTIHSGQDRDPLPTNQIRT